MKDLIKIMGLVVLLMSLSIGCYRDNKEDLYQNLANTNPCDSTADSSSISYSADVSPILESNCALSGCHVGSSPQSGIDLSNYNDVRTVARNGRLVGTITGSPGPQMPPSGPQLSAMEIDQIQTWVENGACEN